MQVSSKLLYKTAIMLLALLLVTMAFVVINQIQQANAAASLPVNANWTIVKNAINSYITGQFGAGGSQGEAGFTMDNAGLQPRIDSNNNGTYLGEGDNAVNAPVLVDNLRGQTTIIPATSYRCSWNADCFESANVATVKGLVDAHVAAGFSTDTVVYCGSGHTEAPTTGAYGFIAQASDGAGGYGLSSAGTAIPKVYAFKWGRNGWKNTVATYANTGTMGSVEAEAASTTVTPYSGCGSPLNDADLVRCEARYAVYLTANGGRYAVTTNGTASLATIGAAGQSVDIRTGPPATTISTGNSNVSVPLNTLFNSGLTSLDGSATTVIVGRTPMVSGIAAQGVNMLGYNMIDGTYINGGLPGWNNGELEPQVSQTTYSVVAIAGYGAPAKVDNTPPYICTAIACGGGVTAAADSTTTAYVTRKTTSDPTGATYVAEPATSKIQLIGSDSTTANVNSTVLNADKTVEIYGLNPGVTYSGTLTVYDGQANGSSTAISPFTMPTSGPTSALSLALPVAYWFSYTDFVADTLSVDWTITNNGGTTATNVMLYSNSNTNGVTVKSGSPASYGNIAPSASVGKTVKYQGIVSGGYITVGSWHTDNIGSSG